MTTFKALYGRDPPTLVKPTYTSADLAEVVTQISDREQVLQQLKSNLNKAQQRMKMQADKKRIDVQFKVGEAVLVKLRPYRQHSVALRTTS